MKLIVCLVATAATLVVMPSTTATAVTTEARSQVTDIRKATVKSSAVEVTEGDRIALRVRVPQAKNARRVVLQERRIDVFGQAQWTDIDSKRARGQLKYRLTVTAQNEATYRVAITYRGRAKPVLSRPTKLTVWRWIELREFAPYFQTSLAGYGEADMNGSRYAAWGGYAGTSIRSWEARVTPGRNCTRFRAILGLADTSDDDSSGVVSFAVDEATTVYQSPPLTPGMTVPVTLELARPYRFGMAAANTSADKVRAYPMVGNGAFYCTGITD